MENVVLVNQYVRAHRHGLQFLHPEMMPIDPLDWMDMRCSRDLFTVLVQMLTALEMRGASMADCARYAFDRSVGLPFLEDEPIQFELILTTLAIDGHEPEDIAQLVEMAGLILDAVR